MAEHSGIEWTESTWNPLTGCKHCYAERMAKRIPHSELIVIPDAGHLSNMEQPNYFNRAIDSFAASLLKAGA